MRNLKNLKDYSEELKSEIFESKDSSKKSSASDKLFNIFGVTCSDDGIVTVKNKWGKLLCKMAVADNRLEKIDDKTFKLKK